MMKKSFVVGIVPAHSSYFLAVIYMKKPFPFLSSSPHDL